MKTAIFLTVLAAIALSQAAVVPGPTSRANLQVGYIGAGDRLLYRTYLIKNPIPNAVQYQDFIYRGNATTRITSVRAIEVGATQYASAWILQGGIGWNNVTVRVQSYRSWGYYYMIEVWGR